MVLVRKSIDDTDNKGADHLLIDPYTETNKKLSHCFISLERTNKIFKKAFDKMISTLKDKCSD